MEGSGGIQSEGRKVEGGRPSRGKWRESERVKESGGSQRSEGQRQVGAKKA